MNELTIYNPDSEDFSTTYDLDGNKQPLRYTLHAKEYGIFPSAVAEHLQKHLAHKIVMKRGVKTNYADEYQQVLKEIEYG